MSRREFPRKVKLAAAVRANGRCECCGNRLRAGDFHYDHDIPDFLGGEPTLENCRVLCLICHKAKTKGVDTPRIVKSRGQRDMALNIRSAPKMRSGGFRPTAAQHTATTPHSKPVLHIRGRQEVDHG